MSAVAHPVEWRRPSPLWPVTAPTDTTSLLSPTLLRLAADSFMADLARLLATHPRNLQDLIAEPLSFRLSGPGFESDPAPTLEHLKLYQPAHGDYYLVAASLVCRIPGLPDRTVNAAAGDKVAFVLRRLTEDGELAWVDDPTSPTRHSWLPVAAGNVKKVAPGEDLLPMFPLNFTDGDEQRRLLVGYIPTASKESFVATRTIDPSPTLPSDTRYDELAVKILEPLDGLIARKAEPVDADRIEASLFALLDFASFLKRYLPSVWNAIQTGVLPPPGDARNLYTALVAQSADPGAGKTWKAALADVWADRAKIGGDSTETSKLSIDLAQSNIGSTALKPLVQSALPPIATATAPAVAPLPVPKLDPRGDALYHLRCVYLRPQCGPLDPDVVSDPTEPFAIASFFDFDAPARDIQIVLPADVSIKDLRKFQRNVRFVMSDQLRRKLGRIAPPADVTQGKLGPDPGLSLGWICSMSIPIITICAMIVLFIFISLLNIVFWWLPFVRICLPVPMKGR